MKKLLIGPIVALGLVTGLVASGGAASATAPHIVGAWSDNDSDNNTSGGWVLWSNGKLDALSGAPFYGDARKQGLNNFVGMVDDTQFKGYWLVTSTGKVFSYGQACPDEALTIPHNVPTSGIIGAIDQQNQINEGFSLVSSTGALYNFTCTFGM
jgi:hypothetical protein